MSRPSDDQSQEFFATAFKLESTVQYQDRSIVSREILNKKAGTLTLFAFDKGQGLSEHTAPYDATILILDGKAEIIIDKKPHIVQSGEFIIMPANVPHEVKAAERFKMLLIMIRSSE